MEIHRTDLYVLGYALFASGAVTLSAFVILPSLGVGLERVAGALLILGAFGILLLRPWERRDVNAAVHTFADTSAPPTRLVSSTDNIDPWVVCFGLILWGSVSLAFV